MKEKLIYPLLVVVSLCCALGARAFLQLLSTAWFPFLEKLDVVVILLFLALPWVLLHEAEKIIKREHDTEEALRKRSEQARYEEQDAILRHYPLLESPDDPSGICSRKNLDQYFESHACEHDIFQ